MRPNPTALPCISLLTAATCLALLAGCTNPRSPQVDAPKAATATATAPSNDAPKPSAPPKSTTPASTSITHPTTVAEAFAKAPKVGTKSSKTDEDWKTLLQGESYTILRKEGTERAFTGAYWNTKDEGVYVCAACSAPLFSSKDKFKSGTGWPSYTQPVQKGRVGTHEDRRYGMVRTEIHCDHCGGHLGHVFEDGPAPTGLRYCVNSASVHLVKGSVEDIPKP